MNSRDLKYIIEEIKENEGLDLTAIAAKTRLNRSYLSKFINSVEEKEVTSQLLNKFKKQYPSYFGTKQQQTTQPVGPDPNLDEVMKSLSRLENGQAFLKAEVRGWGQYGILKSSGWNQEVFLQEWVKVGKLIGANIQVDVGQGNEGAGK